MNHWGVSPCCTNPPGRKRRTPQRHKYTKGTTEPSNHHQLSPIMRDSHRGPDDRDCHTHTDSQDHCAQDGRDTIDIWLCTRAPTSRRCGHARRRSTPTPRGDAQTTHRARAIVLSVLRRPTCPHSNTIGQNQAGMHPQQRKHIGANPPSGEDTPGRTNPKKEHPGYMDEGLCAQTDLCPLASPRVALVGVRLLRHPDNGNTR